MPELTAEATSEQTVERHSVWQELRETFADRAINVRTLPRTMRLVVGAAYAQIIVAVVLIGVRAFGLGATPVQTLLPNGQNLPLVTYAVVLLALAIAWATLLTGAFLAHPLARAAALAAFTVFFQAFSNASAELGLFLAYILMIGVWIAFFVSLFRKPKSFEKTFVPLFIVVIAIGVLVYAGSGGTGGISLRFGSSVAFAMGTLLFMLFAVLAMAGGELGDWAQLGGTGIGTALVRVPTARARAIVVLLAALVFIPFGFGVVQVWRISAYNFLNALPLIAFAGCVVAVVAYSARRFGTPRVVHIPWFALAGASVLYAISLGLGPAMDTLRSTSDSGYMLFRSALHRREFRIDMPAGWQERDLGSGNAQGSYFFDPHSRAGFAVFALAMPEARVPKSGALVAAEESPSKIVSSREAGYDREFLVKKSYGMERVVVRRLRGNGVTWQLESHDADSDFAAQSTTFEQMRGTFSVGEEKNPFNGFRAMGVVLMTFVGLLAGITLLRRFTVSAAFFAIFSVLFVGENIDQFVIAVWGGTGWGAPVIRLGTVDFAVAASAIALLAILAIRRHPAFSRATILLGSTIAGLAMLNAIRALYGAAIAAGEISLAQAAIVFLALSWDIVMSGESITNGDSKAFPRAARLGMFLGYVMLVAAAILFYASFKTLDGETASSFESEGIVRFGIIALGVPLLLTAFMIRLVALFVSPAEPAVVVAENPAAQALVTEPPPLAVPVAAAETVPVALAQPEPSSPVAPATEPATLPEPKPEPEQSKLSNS